LNYTDAKPPVDPIGEEFLNTLPEARNAATKLEASRIVPISQVIADID
jgi:hypothetical protein